MIHFNIHPQSQPTQAPRAVRRLAPILCLVALYSVGCTKTIPVELDTYEQRVAIEGLLQPGTLPRIFVSRTVPFFTDGQSPSDLFVRGAQVTIASMDGVDMLVADSVYDSFWCRYELFYSGSIQTRDNIAYTLTVATGGETFTASTTTSVSPVTIDSASYTSNFTDLYGGHEGVIIDFADIAGQPNQYRVRIDRPLSSLHETVDDFEYSSECLGDGETALVKEYGRFVYFDTSFDGAPVRFVVEPAYTHRKDDTAVIYIQSLDLKAAEYFDILDRQRESNINPFIEPVFLESRIDGAIGVFGSANLSPGFPFVFPEDSG